ncbi:MAG: AAA family ATPase [Bacteroidota bacterium]
MKKRPHKKRYRDHELDDIPTKHPTEWESDYNIKKDERVDSKTLLVTDNCNVTNSKLKTKKDPTKTNPIPRVLHEQDKSFPELPKIEMNDQLCTLDHIWNLPDVENKFLVDKFIPKEAITILGGTSDVGKSLFTLQLSMAIIQNKDSILGQQIKVDYNSVLLVSTEDNRIQILSRIRKQLHGDKLSKLMRERLIILTTSENVSNEIEKILTKYPVDLVVVDAFSDIFEGDMNTSNQVRKCLSMFQNTIARYGCSFLIVHHIRKDSKQAPNKDQFLGSGGIPAKARNSLMLTKKWIKGFDVRQINIVKGNYISEEDKRKDWYYFFNEQTLSLEETPDDFLKQTKYKYVVGPESGNPDESSIRSLKILANDLREKGQTYDEIATRVGRNKSTVWRWLKAK